LNDTKYLSGAGDSSRERIRISMPGEMSHSTSRRSISSPRELLERLKNSPAKSREHPKLISLSKLKELMHKNSVGGHRYDLHDRAVDCGLFRGESQPSLPVVTTIAGTLSGRIKNDKQRVAWAESRQIGCIIELLTASKINLDSSYPNFNQPQSHLASELAKTLTS
jgi:hypothetical protein